MDNKLFTILLWLAAAGTACLVTALRLMGVVPAPVATAVVLAVLLCAWLGGRRLRR